MDFDLSAEQSEALEGWRKFVQRDIAPLAKKHQDQSFSREVALELLSMSTSFGVGCGWVPEDGGGAGLDFLTSGLLFEELSRTSPDTAGLAWVVEGAALKVYHNASEELKARYLPGLVSGKLIACSAISEPDVGSSVRDIRTKAVRDGKHFRISGEKIWTSNASIADIVLVLARTGEDEFSMFLVDREEHGFKTQEIPKLGLNGWPMGQITFEDIMVPEENLIGGAGSGLRETMKGFERSRCFVSTLALGIAQTALDDAVSYATQRRQFGKVIAGHQLVQQLLAEMATDLAAAKLLVYRALSMMAKGQRCELEASIAKSFATEAAQRIATNAIQVHGAFGITKEFPVERHFRNARMLTIPDGTTQINQLIIGRKLTGVSAF